MDHVDPALLGQRRRGPAEPSRRSHRNLDDARGLQDAVLIRVVVRRPLVQLPDVHPVTSSRQGCRQVNDDRQDARPRLLTPRRDLRDAHADTVATVLAMEPTAARLLARDGAVAHATSLPPVRRALDARSNR